MNDYIIEGSDAHDELFGGWGDDIIYGNYGHDNLYGGDGDDILDGGVGSDYLDGGDGNDLLWAGYGLDELVGGRGYDTFGFYAPGDFVIDDFNVFSDTLLFDSQTTGLYHIYDLINAITGIEEDNTGVAIYFSDIASITLVGVSMYDLDLVNVDFA